MVKQYLLMIDDVGLACLKSVCNNRIQFLEVQGMNMQGGEVNVLVTPIIPLPGPSTAPEVPPESPELVE